MASAGLSRDEGNDVLTQQQTFVDDHAITQQHQPSHSQPSARKYSRRESTNYDRKYCFDGEEATEFSRHRAAVTANEHEYLGSNIYDEDCVHNRHKTARVQYNKRRKLNSKCVVESAADVESMISATDTFVPEVLEDIESAHVFGGQSKKIPAEAKGILTRWMLDHQGLQCSMWLATA
jgi:hypothetical protein